MDSLPPVGAELGVGRAGSESHNRVANTVGDLGKRRDGDGRRRGVRVESAAATSVIKVDRLLLPFGIESLESGKVRLLARLSIVDSKHR